jgi:hypothetical protein
MQFSHLCTMTSSSELVDSEHSVISPGLALLL